MNPGEADVVMRRVAGYWPTPRITEAEMEVWHDELMAVDFKEALNALGRLVREDANTRRPTIRHIMAEVRKDRPDTTRQRTPDYWRIIRHDGYSMLLPADRCTACGVERPFPGTTKCRRQLIDCEYIDAVYIEGESPNVGGAVLSDEEYERRGGPILKGDVLKQKLEWLKTMAKPGPLAKSLNRLDDPPKPRRKRCPECGRTMIEASPLTICNDCVEF
jgi:predicted Zn-ribbon and HTH transcriptional regulator